MGSENVIKLINYRIEVGIHTQVLLPSRRTHAGQDSKKNIQKTGEFKLPVFVTTIAFNFPANQSITPENAGQRN